MNNLKKYRLWIALAVVGIGVALYGDKARAAVIGVVSPPDVAPSPGPAPAPAFNRNKLLKRGTKGAEVRALQTSLKGEGLSSQLGNTGPNRDGIDGDFGAKTENALFLARGLRQITLAQFDARTMPTGGTLPGITPPFVPPPANELPFGW